MLQNATPTNDTNYIKAVKAVEGCGTCLTKHIRSILRYITPLIINNVEGELPCTHTYTHAHTHAYTHTRTHTHAHTYAHTHTHTYAKAILRKQAHAGRKFDF